ncbi:MAG: IclR family transcriptional regulator [Nitriliruptorales bacterium]|nr:IclR family transcriptional regulator [Nitriliruptorales bacterium]
MARRAPAIERTVAVLNHLAANPSQQFSLSELARELDLNKATAHAMLNALAEAGYLTRDPRDKSYGLGPGLIAVGTAALEANPAARVAQGPMEQVSRELELECVASAAIGGEIVILESAGVARPLGISIQPGLRLPLVPPLGSVFVAWAGSDEIDRWLSALGPAASADDLDRYRQALRVVRERGYSVGLGGDEQQRMVESLTASDGISRAPTAPGEEYALVELADETPYRINHVGAPVFGPDGRVEIALFLIGFRGEIRASEVPAYAVRLKEAADEVTAAIGGIIPAPA